MNYKDMFVKIIRDKDLTLDFKKVRKDIKYNIDKNKSSVIFEDAIRQVENSINFLNK